jgi:hypothetical protein
VFLYVFLYAHKGFGGVFMVLRKIFVAYALLIAGVHVFALEYNWSDVMPVAHKAGRVHFLGMEARNPSVELKNPAVQSLLFSVIAGKYGSASSDAIARYRKHSIWYGSNLCDFVIPVNAINEKRNEEWLHYTRMPDMDYAFNEKIFFSNHVVYPVVDYALGNIAEKSSYFKNDTIYDKDNKLRQFAVENGRLVLGAAITRSVLVGMGHSFSKKLNSKESNHVKYFAKQAATQIALNGVDELVISPAVNCILPDGYGRDIAKVLVNYYAFDVVASLLR